MGWVFTRARRITKRRHSKEAQAILDRLAAYLHDNESEPVEMLCGFWRDQQDAITYQEMRELVLQGYVDEVTARLWQQDYSELVKNRMPRIWNGAMIQGAANTPLLSALSGFVFNTQTPGVIRWIQSRGAEMVTVSTQRQKDAIALLLEDKMRNAHTVDELARLIRPCVGLYRQQAAAVRNYYETMVKTLTEQHPRTRPGRIQLKALDKAAKYAERLHRQRAMMIAQTEMAFAYNYGADEGVRQAQENFLIGRCEKVWVTALDDNVCDACKALNNTRVGMEERFYDGNTRYEESGLYPPLHPRCACAVQYVEVESPIIPKNLLANSPPSGIMTTIQSPIESRGTDHGNPAAIIHFDSPLNKRQEKLLDRLPGYGDRTIVRKNTVSMKDLAALTAGTGDEFAMFTKSGERLIIRGNATETPITYKNAKALAEDGYRWSGHTHPGTNNNCLMASDGDMFILSAFPQKRSAIYNSTGKHNIFDKD